MKQVLIIAVALGVAACGTADKKTGPGLTQAQIEKAAVNTANFTSIEWLDSTSQNLGKAKEGQIVEVRYRFKNTGTKPLIIEDVKAGCGCTVPEKPEQPYAPGQEGVIKAKFDSHNRKGPNEKYINVKANTSPYNDHALSFKIVITD